MNKLAKDIYRLAQFVESDSKMDAKNKAMKDRLKPEVIEALVALDKALLSLDKVVWRDRTTENLFKKVDVAASELTKGLANLYGIDRVRY